MYLKKALAVVLCVVAIAAATVALTGCAARTGACTWGDLDTGLILEYRMSEGDPVSYTFTSSSVQTMEIQGQLIPVESVGTNTNDRFLYLASASPLRTRVYI